MRQRDPDARDPATPQHIMGSKRGQYGQWPNNAWKLARQPTQRAASFPQQELARGRVAAVGSAVSKRPERTGSFGISGLSAEQPRADAEQDTSAQTQSLRLLTTPRKRLEKRKPRVFEGRQLLAAYASAEQLARDGAQPRLAGRRYSSVELFQPLSPPGEADRSKRRLGRRGDHVGQRQVEVPECRECRPDGARNGGKRRQAVGIERPLSDR
jgi:hypothetical protein